MELTNILSGILQVLPSQVLAAGKMSESEHLWAPNISWFSKGLVNKKSRKNLLFAPRTGASLRTEQGRY